MRVCVYIFVCMCVQNVLGEEGIGFKIAMGAFDKTRPPVSMSVNSDNSVALYVTAWMATRSLPHGSGTEAS